MTRALVVDDSITMQNMISVALTRAGFEVKVASNGREALSTAAAPFDLIITDLNMPVMDGFTFIKGVRALGHHKFTPVLVLTTEASSERREQGKIAPGNRHLRMRRSGAEYTLHLSDDERVHHCRPAVDVLFDSAAVALGPNAIAAVLTGMGCDGAAGLKRMRDAGARTLAQDEASSVVYGMPKEALARGGVERVVSLREMASSILTLTRAGR